MRGKSQELTVKTEEERASAETKKAAAEDPPDTCWARHHTNNRVTALQGDQLTETRRTQVTFKGIHIQEGKQKGEVSTKSSRSRLVMLQAAAEGNEVPGGAGPEIRHPCLAGREQRFAGKELPAPGVGLIQHWARARAATPQ